MIRLLICTAASALFALSASAATPGRTSFEILMNGKPVGAHSVTVRREGERAIATVAINMKGSVGPFSFTYGHQCTEEWRGDALQSLSCVDREGRRESRVSATRGADGLRVQGPKASVDPIAQAIPTSWWRRDITREARLLDTRTGAMMPVKVSRIGQGPITVQGQTIMTTHYSVRGSSPAEIWYDSEGRWVKMSFTLRGQKFEYRKTSPLNAGPIG